MADANVTLPHAPSQRTPIAGHRHRRQLLGALAAAPMAAAAPATAVEAEDPHVGWERRIPELLAKFKSTSEDDRETYDAAWDRWWGMRERILLTPARTPAGIAAQVRLALKTTQEGSTLANAEEEGLRLAVRSLERLAGKA